MQKDFHFYTIYFLARCINYSHKEAHIIAYASQFVDDADKSISFHFANGGYFKPIVTSHNYHRISGAIKSLKKSSGYEVWIPFHFFPGGQKEGKSKDPFYQKLEVKPVNFKDNMPLNKALDRILEERKKPYDLHLLGISLHVLADTWSHQGFIGLTRPENDVRNLKIEGENKNFLRHLREEFYNLFPKTGHAEAYTIPDEPYRRWSYVDCNDKIHKIDNTKRCLLAAKACYYLLEAFLKKRKKKKSVQISFEDLESELTNIFNYQASLEERCKKWLEIIKRNPFFKFNSSQELLYYPGTWFHEAIKINWDEINQIQFFWQSNFNNTNWRLFYAAASFWRFIILNEILPNEGVICGT